MRMPTALFTTTALALITASGAFADVTAQEVWENLQSQYADTDDVTVSIGQEQIGDGVVDVTNMRISHREGRAETTAVISALRFEETGDGSVAIRFPVDVPVSITEGPSVTSLTLSNKGLVITVSGDEAAMDYDLAADMFKVASNPVLDENRFVPGEGHITMRDLAASFAWEDGDARGLSVDFNAASTDFAFDASTSNSSNAMTVSGQIADFASSAEMSGPGGMVLEGWENDDIGAVMMRAGYTFGAVSYDFALRDNGQDMQADVQIDSGALDVSLTEGQLNYGTNFTGLRVNGIGSEVPIPIEVSLAELAMQFGMPLVATEDPAPFRVGFNLDQLSVPDNLWSIFDPAGQLPRGPVTVQLGLSGLATLLADANSAEFDDLDVPFEPASLQIDTLNIDAVGVQVAGEGAFEFDATDTTTFPGFPRPEGSARLTATGVNGLLDALVNMGLMPADQIMGARMMMGMFANTTGDDALESSVELNAEGHVFVNGQRMR